MRYRELVTIQEQAQQRSSKGAVTRTWTNLLTDVPATIVASVIESNGAEMQVVADRFDIVLAGKRAVETDMSILDSHGRRFDVESVDFLLGGRQTHVVARLVSPAVPVGS